MTILNLEEFKKGYEKFEENEKRNAMYEVAKFLVLHFWGKPPKMTDALGVLLLTWNQAFYRYGIFDFDKLEKCITDNLPKIETFRTRDINSFSNSDEDDIKKLFDEFLKALQINSGKKQGTTSPVAVAKALHLLAPNFFPLWDDKIARAYRCYYNENPVDKYISFCKKIKIMAVQLGNQIPRADKTIIKLIDEYNYSKFTKGWI